MRCQVGIKIIITTNRRIMKKKLFISISLLAILVGCTHQFKGFLVCKEYVPGHMDDKKVQSVQEAIVFVPPPRMPDPEYIPSEWKFYVANKNGVRVFNVDSLTYVRHKVGERIVMTFK